MLHAVDFLKRALRRATAEEFLLANNHVTKETIQTRVFEKVARLMETKTYDFSNVYYVHPEVSTFLSQHIPPDHPAFDENDRLLASRIYSRDYHDAQTLYAFCTLLDTKIAVLGSSERNRLHRAFAVDGFHGLSLIEYIYNLKYPLSKLEEKDDKKRAIEKHVSAVRLLYETFDTVSVETVAIAIRNAMDYVESVDPELQRMTNVYLSHVVENFDNIKTFIGILKDSIQEKVLIE